MAKLTRIWEPLSPVKKPSSMPWERRSIELICATPKNLGVEIQLGSQGFSPERITLEGENCVLIYDQKHHPLIRFHYFAHGPTWPHNHFEISEQFATRHMTLFRRNCWLSGCPIECTAHEQIEWSLWFQGQDEHP